MNAYKPPQNQTPADAQVALVGDLMVGVDGLHATAFGDGQALPARPSQPARHDTVGNPAAVIERSQPVTDAPTAARLSDASWPTST